MNGDFHRHPAHLRHLLRILAADLSDRIDFERLAPLATSHGDRLRSQEIEAMSKTIVQHFIETVKTAPRAPVPLFDAASLWADKKDQRRWIRDLFAVLSIQGTPIGAERLQEQMALSGLATDELSRDLVEAREE